MTTEEMNLAFDILYNNLSSNQAPGLNEYEKSFLLSQAQLELVQQCYSSSSPTALSIEIDEKTRRALAQLVKTDIKNVMTLTEEDTGIYTAVDPDDTTSTNYTVTPLTDGDSYFFKTPDRMMYITYESARLASEDLCNNGKFVNCIPCKQDEFDKTYEDPFKGPTSKRVLRLDIDNDIVEIVSSYPIDKYKVRYVMRPHPIILTDLSDYDEQIDGESDESACQLDESIQNMIVTIAAQKAKLLWINPLDQGEAPQRG